MSKQDLVATILFVLLIAMIIVLSAGINYLMAAMICSRC